MSGADRDRGVVEIVEVGPRDGLQNDPGSMSTAEKAKFIARLEACGVRRVEAGSFVSPRAVPKMADSADVFRQLAPHPDSVRIGLALNEKGVRRALDAGAGEINFVLVASEAFGRRNQGMSPAESLDMLRRCAPLVLERGVPLSATISVAFGDPYTGDVALADVAGLAEGAAAAGAGEIALGDTIGAATPWQVGEAVALLRERVPAARLRMHFHDTRGAGLANVFAAVEGGVRIIDASVGGLGGCPFAPAATGNVATEAVAWMLHRAGFRTGLDLDGLLDTARWAEERLGHGADSALLRAGIFPPPQKPAA